MTSTIDHKEIAKFSNHASAWWDTEGPLKTLHDINPIRLQFIQQHFSLSGCRVLDVGCGGGILSEGMASLGAIVTGLDAEPNAIEAAKAHTSVVEYVCQPIECFDAPPFEAITCLEMLEHVQEPSLVLAHCARLLKPGGMLFLSTINRTFEAYAKVILAGEYLLGLLPRETHEYAKFIKPSELAAAARALGFETVSLQGMAYHPFTRKASLGGSTQMNYLLACCLVA